MFISSLLEVVACDKNAEGGGGGGGFVLICPFGCWGVIKVAKFCWSWTEASGWGIVATEVWGWAPNGGFK